MAVGVDDGRRPAAATQSDHHMHHVLQNRLIKKKSRDGGK